MGNVLEDFRRKQLGQSNYPMGRGMAKNVRDRLKKGEESSKVRNAARKAFQQEEFMHNFPDVQLMRSLGKVLLGSATPQDMNHIDGFGQVVEEFISERGNRVTITIVDFPSEISISKEKPIGHE